MSVPTPQPETPAQQRSNRTRNSILDAAEDLFAQRSFAAVSMRDITGKAGVGLALANYHFGSKEGLFKEVFLRRARELNQERADLLKDAGRRAGGAAVPLRDVLTALLRPGIRWSFDPGGRGLFVQFLIRCQSDLSSPLRDLFYRDIGHLTRFVPYLERALPELDRQDIFWRLHFVLGALHYTITDLKRLEAISDGACNVDDPDEALARIVDCAVATFTAPDSGRGDGQSAPTRTVGQGPGFP